eukprot:SAG31_NODE_1822_length_7193_cov_3.631802_9_plen_78_part_00
MLGRILNIPFLPEYYLIDILNCTEFTSPSVLFRLLVHPILVRARTWSLSRGGALMGMTQHLVAVLMGLLYLNLGTYF